MHSIDANLVTVQWGLIGVFGVVVGLLIDPADRFLQAFLDSGKTTDHRRAALWAASLKVTAVMVWLGLVGLSMVGAIDAGLDRTARFEMGMWLLLAPLLAQAGFVILVLCLVKRVPQLKILLLQRETPGDRSPSGYRDRTVIRFVNQTSVEMSVCWLDYEGQQDARGPWSVAAGDEATQSTYQGHRFLIAMDKATFTVEAAATPGCVVVEPKDLEVGNAK